LVWHASFVQAGSGSKTWFLGIVGQCRAEADQQKLAPQQTKTHQEHGNMLRAWMKGVDAGASMIFSAFSDL